MRHAFVPRAAVEAQQSAQLFMRYAGKAEGERRMSSENEKRFFTVVELSFT
jgi:hypothetical protein